VGVGWIPVVCVDVGVGRIPVVCVDVGIGVCVSRVVAVSRGLVIGASQTCSFSSELTEGLLTGTKFVLGQHPKIKQ